MSVPAVDPIAAPAAHRLSWSVAAISVGLLAVVALLGATVGAAGIPPSSVMASLVDGIPGVDGSALTGAEPLTERQRDILLSIRLPRLVLGLLVGSALGMSGAAFQGVFRNPLADPYLLGVSAGAGFGAVVALGLDVDLGWGPFGAIPAAAFLGALAAVTGSVLVARGSWRSPATLLLAGVAMASLFAASQTFILQRLDQARTREVLSWLFGQLSARGWSEVQLLGPYVVVCGAVLFLHRRHLDILRVGDDEARSLGLDPVRTRMVLVVAASLLTAAAVAVSGLIAFVGLVVPHLVRLLVSHSYRVIVPMSALIGATFLALVDVGARTIVSPAELPVGVITSFVGAPFFAFVLWRGAEEAL